MVLKDFRGALLTRVDKGDPRNRVVVAHVKVWIDGQFHAWRGEASRSEHQGEQETIDAAIADLVVQVLKNPRQPAIEGMPTVRVA